MAIAYSKSKKLKDAFCHIALYAEHVNFGFNRGSELTKSSVVFQGKGKLIRHIKVKDFNDLPKKEMKKMIWEAVVNSERLNPKLLEIKDNPQSFVMSISEKKIRPNIQD